MVENGRDHNLGSRRRSHDPAFLFLSRYLMNAETRREEETMESISNKGRWSIAAKSRLVGCMVLISIVAVASAQQTNVKPTSSRQHTVDRRPPLDREFDSLSKKLKLTDEQKPRVRPILEKKDEEIKRIMENPSLQRVDNRYKKYEKIAKIHDKYRGKIRKLLTDGQKVKFDKVDLRTD